MNKILDEMREYAAGTKTFDRVPVRRPDLSAWIAYLESQQARDTAQATQLRALEAENERLKVELERLCFVEVECEGMIHLRKQADAENERLRGLLKVAVGRHRSDCPCPCCKAVDTPAVKPAETIGPADDDALEIPLREASDGD